MDKEIQTEADIQAVIGQYESIRLEFKSSRLLEQTKHQVIEALAKEVSAFANTEGGTIVIGVETGKGADKSLAVALSDGVDPDQTRPEWLQQVIASNISPPLHGLVVRPIALSKVKPGRVAYAIIVPKGETAHQSQFDLKYYGRYELEAKALPDNAIRLLMHRTRAAHALIELTHISALTAAEEHKRRQSTLEVDRKESEVGMIPPARLRMLTAPKRSYDEYRFSLAIKNDGPITIRHCRLEVLFKADFEIQQNGTNQSGPLFSFDFGGTTVEQSRHEFGGHESTYEVKLFPHERIPFPGATFIARPPADAPLAGTAEWSLFLDDAPKASGTLRLSNDIAAS